MGGVQPVRTTSRRQLTAKEEMMVDLIVDELWECRQLGDAQIARAARMGWAAGRDRKRAQSRIYFLMPDIVCEIARLHPGFAAVRRHRAGLVEVTEDPDRVVRVAVPRFHQVHTKVVRLRAELGPALNGTPEQQAFAKITGTVEAVLELGEILAVAALQGADQN
jgi:hypothetical protein